LAQVRVFKVVTIICAWEVVSCIAVTMGQICCAAQPQSVLDKPTTINGAAGTDEAEALSVIQDAEEIDVPDPGFKQHRVHDMRKSISVLSRKSEGPAVEKRLSLTVAGSKVAFGCLMVDLCQEDSPLTELVIGEQFSLYMSICEGVTKEALSKKKLEPAHILAIKRAMKRIVENCKTDRNKLTGITGNHPLWILHTDEINQALQRPVYLSVLIQLPMIMAAFKNFENVLVVTPDGAALNDSWPLLSESAHLNFPIDRLTVIGLSELTSKWLDFISGTTTPAEDNAIGLKLLRLCKEKVDAANADSTKKDGFIRAILLGGPKLMAFSDVLRETCCLPVFDVATLLGYFSQASSKSSWEVSDHDRRETSQDVRQLGSIAEDEDTMAVGVLRLDYHYPPAVGDIAHPDSYGFTTYQEEVKGLFFDVAQAGGFQEEVLHNMTEAIKRLEARNVVGITGDCGFMMHYQCFARYVAKVPVFMSALIQCASLGAAVGHDKRVLILTANSETLKPGADKLLMQSGIEVNDPNTFIIEGLQDLEGFEAVALAEAVDVELVKKTIVVRVDEIIAREKENGTPIAIVLLECTELPAYADVLRSSTGMPVLDAITCVNFFHMASPKGEFSASTFAPHNMNFWIKNFMKDGASALKNNAVDG